MRICFVSSGDLSAYSEKQADFNAEIVCFSFMALGQVSYEKELKGETSLFEDVALLSKEGQNVVVCGCYSDSRGILRKSVVVADRGRILGVSDMINRLDASEYRPGAGIKLYDTKAGKVGIIVAEDLYFPKVTETISLCGADLIVCIAEELNEGLEQVLIRANAYTYGVPICLCSYGYAAAADATGKLAFASPNSPCAFDMRREQEYHIVETRKRGFFLHKRSGY